MADRDNETISKQDIFNMMDSYKSNVEFNKELLESQVKILDQHSIIIVNLSKVNDDQTSLGSHVEKLIERLTIHHNDCNSNKNESLKTVKLGVDTINNHHIETIKSHNVLKNSIITGAGILSGIVCSLFYIIYQLIDKFNKLEAIAKHLGV